MVGAVLDAGGNGQVAMLHALEDRAQNRPALIRLLLDRGIRHDRALTLAAHVGDLEVVRLLLDHGSTDIESALINAQRQGHQEIAVVLESGTEAGD